MCKLGKSKLAVARGQGRVEIRRKPGVFWAAPLRTCFMTCSLLPAPCASWLPMDSEVHQFLPSRFPVQKITREESSVLGLHREGARPGLAPGSSDSAAQQTKLGVAALGREQGWIGIVPDAAHLNLCTVRLPLQCQFLLSATSSCQSRGSQAMGLRGASAVQPP